MATNPTSTSRTPWPFVCVKVILEDGRETFAVWTGHIWWGEGRELTVVHWEAVNLLSEVAA